MDKKIVAALNFEAVIIAASQLPLCKIDRYEFLTEQLKSKVSPAQLADALENGTINAGIPVGMLNELADGSIKLETTRVSLISAAAGMPGGLAMMAAVPADLAQFYAHVLRIAQKLAYIYNYKEFGNLDDAAKNVLMIFIGVMFGVEAAGAALVKLTAANAGKIAARVAAKPLSKYAVYNIAKRVLAWIGIKVTKDGVRRAVAKIVPIVGALISGVYTYATFSLMAGKLRKALSKLAAMSPEKLEKASAEADDILAEYGIV